MFNMVNKVEIIKKLNALGFTQDEADVYVALYNRAPVSPLSLSRETGINRSTVYRIVERLEQSGFVKRTVEYKTTRYVANSAESLTLFVSQKEAEVQKLKQEMAPLLRELDALPPEADNGPTHVYYYKGVSGLRQLLWHTLEAENEVVGFGYTDWNAGIGKRFAEKIRAQYVERNLHAKELLNQDPLNFTDIKEYLRICYEHRVIQKNILPIQHDTYIYNDVFAFYHIYKGELFGVEIHNAEIVNTQRRLFYLLWKQAKKAK